MGGTLSNAGMSGQTFHHGPQINNILQMEMVTGTRQIVTCFVSKQPELFFAIFNGLGQFGIITKAHILLVPTP
jgi:cytokinin dehydrogenase